MRGIQSLDGNAGVVLDDPSTVFQKKVPGGGEVPAVRKIGSGFEKGCPGAELAAEPEEARIIIDPAIRKIRLEVIEGLPLPASGEGESRPGCGGFAGDHGARVIEPNDLGPFQFAPGPRQEDIEDRQGAVELVLAEVSLHVLRFEEGETEDGLERLAEVGQAGAEGSGGQAHEIWRGAHGFEAGEDIGRCFGIEFLGVEDIRAAEEIEHGPL